MFYDKISFWLVMISMFAFIIPANKFLKVKILATQNENNQIIDKRKNSINIKISEHQFFNNLISKKDLISISTDKFILWCIHLLKLMNITNIEPCSERAEGSISFVCTDDNSTISVDFFHVVPTCDLDNDRCYPTIGRPAIQQITGSMFQDGIKKGIVFTTGYFTDPAIEYVNNLPEGYELQLVDGDTLSIKHWMLLNS